MIFFVRSIFLIFFTLTSWAQEVVPLDRVVAIVGEGVITDLELRSELEVAFAELSKQGTPVTRSKEFRRQVLERMITVKVLTDLADKTGIRVSDEDIRLALRGLARERGLTVQEYINAIEESGGGIEKLREQLVAETKIIKLRRRDVESRVIVNETEIDAFLKRIEASSDKRDESLLAHVLIRIPEGATPSEIDGAGSRATEALRRIDSGVDFRKVAAEMSDATDALEGGVLGWRSESSLPDLFIEALKQMRIGGRSEVLRSPNGFHILFLLDKRGVGAQVIVQQTLARHILIRVDTAMPEEEALMRVNEIRNRIIVGKEDFEKLAKSLSDDLTASKGGELGWLMAGETVPEFERAMDRLQIGEVSDPVRTQFGYHVIQVLERRDADVSLERKRNIARQSITQKKLEFRFQEWVREVRDTTFIKYVDLY